MNGYTDLTTNIENSRNSLRRIARHDDQEFSKESIINVMEKFVKTVNIMDETILVPCRLMDRQVGDSTDTVLTSPAETQSSTHHAHHHHHANGKKKSNHIREKLNNADLFNLYNMLNTVKVSLLWGKNPSEEEILAANSGLNLNTQIAEVDTLPANNESANTNNNVHTASAPKEIKGHIRRPSTVSMASSNSTSTLSDSESEISNENDSGVESESNRENDKSTELARQCRSHLLGLHRCLEQMTDASLYLTARYQSDIGPV